MVRSQSQLKPEASELLARADGLESDDDGRLTEAIASSTQTISTLNSTKRPTNRSLNPIDGNDELLVFVIGTRP